MGIFYHRVTVHRKSLIKCVFSVQPDNLYYVLENRLLKKTFLMVAPVLIFTVVNILMTSMNAAIFPK